MSGRALFKYDPTLFKDDEDAADTDVYEERVEEEEEKNDDEGKKIREGNDNTESTAAVDADLFQAEAGGDEEEPDFE